MTRPRTITTQPIESFASEDMRTGERVRVSVQQTVALGIKQQCAWPLSRIGFNLFDFVSHDSRTEPPRMTHDRTVQSDAW